MAASPDPARWALFDTVSEDDARGLLAVARRQRFAKGETIFREGDTGDSLYLIDSGHVAVRVTTPDGDVAMLQVQGPDDHFGELGLVSSGTRSATVTAIEPTVTLAIARRQVDELRAAHPQVDRVLLEAMVQHVRRLSEQLRDAMYLPVPTRVVRRLLDLAGQFPTHGGAVIPLTQDDLAGLCGATRPTVNQVLRELQAKDLVELGRGRITILDVKGLRAALPA